VPARSNSDTTHRLEAQLVVEAPAEVLFDALCDLRARAKDVPAFEQVVIRESTGDGFIAEMREHYGGRDITVISKFRVERPFSLSYEHLESPYGVNRGKFTIHDTGDRRLLHQVHETEQDVSPGTALRDDWLRLMHEILGSIKRDAEARQ
jgi:hypothetical protein